VIAGLAPFDMHHLYRAAAPPGSVAGEDKGSHVTRGTTVARRYDHVFASHGLRLWHFAYRHEVRQASER
jgi:hypothetical protein